MSLLISQQKVNIILKQNDIFCTVVSGLKVSGTEDRHWFGGIMWKKVALH